MSLFKLKEVEEIKPVVQEFFHTGSRVICDPPPTDTDDDYLVLVGEGAIGYVKDTLIKNEWVQGGSFDPKVKTWNNGEFVSLKKAEYNLILTADPEYLAGFKRATYLASHLNLLKKEDRITLFEAVLRGNYPDRLKTSKKKRKSWGDLYFGDKIDLNPGAINLVEQDFAAAEQRVLGAVEREVLPDMVELQVNVVQGVNQAAAGINPVWVAMDDILMGEVNQLRND